MAKIYSFPTPFLSQENITKLEDLQISIHEIWEDYIRNNDVLLYEEELKKDFDKNITRMKKGYRWDNPKIELYFYEISCFPDKLEDYMFLVFAFTSLSNQIPDILNLPEEEIENILVLLLELEYPPNLYEKVVKLYRDEKIQTLLNQGKISRFQKTSVFQIALNSLKEHNRIVDDKNMQKAIEKTSFFQMVQKKCIMGHVILSVEKLYDQLLEDIQLMERTCEEDFELSLYERITHILMISNLPLQEQSNYLMKVNELNYQEMLYYDKLFFLLDMTDTFLEQKKENQQKLLLYKK